MSGFRPPASFVFFVLPRSGAPACKPELDSLVVKIATSLAELDCHELYLVGECTRWRLRPDCRYPFHGEYYQGLRAIEQPLEIKFVIRCPATRTHEVETLLMSAGGILTGNGRPLSETGYHEVWFALSGLPAKQRNSVYCANIW